MATTTAVHDLLLPRAPGGMLRGGALALLAHGAMFVALTTVVQWRASAPDVVAAELWSAVPQIAAPRAAEPPPRPEPPKPPVPEPRPVPKSEPRPEPKAEPALPDPQIAIAQAKAERERKAALEQAERAERERKLAAERERERKEREAEATRRAQAEAQKQKAEEERLARQRERNLERMMGQMTGNGSPTSSGTDAQTSGPSAGYPARLAAAIKPNIVFTETISGNPAAEVEVRAGASGSIIARRLVRSSGNKDWDEAVLRAIDRTGTLPRDVDGRVPPSIIVAFRPKE